MILHPVHVHEEGEYRRVPTADPLNNVGVPKIDAHLFSVGKVACLPSRSSPYNLAIYRPDHLIRCPFDGKSVISVAERAAMLMHRFGVGSLAKACDDIALPGSRVVLTKDLNIHLFPENIDQF